MKTKHILTAMVLPTMLAACTADEIVENNNNIAKNRAEVAAVSFATEGLESRLAFNEDEMAWDWEGTDKFLLLQADGGYNDITEDALPGERFSAGAPSTGYEYAKGEDGLYKTAAAVMEEGLYWGYAPSFNKTYKGYVKYELPTAQYMHVKNEVDTYNNVELAALITPLYEVSALNEGDFYNKLPLEMINFYSTLVMPFKNSTDEDITINQIVFESNTDLVVAGRIKTDALASYIIASDGEEWAPAVNFDDDDENDLTIAELKDEMRKANLIVAADKDAGDKVSKTIVLNLGGYTLEAGKTEEFYMLVPATQGAGIDYSITVVAEEGLVEIKSSDVSNAMEGTKIYHNAQKAAFGRTNKGVARSFVIDEDDFTSMGEAYYVTSYKEMERILDEDVNGTISVYNVGDWGIDANLAKAIENSDAFVIFKNEITIEGTALTAEKALELKKVAFENTATVKKNTKVNFNLSQYVPAASRAVTKKDATVEGLVVSEGAVVTLTKGAFKTIKNKGTLTVCSDATMTNAEIETEGTLNLKDEDAIKSVKLLAGTLNYKTAKTGVNTWNANNANYLTIGTLTGNAEIKVDANVVWTADLKASNWKVDETDGTVKYAVSLTNNGTIKLQGGDAESDMKIYGTFTNNGKIVEGGTFTLYGTSENAEDAVIEVAQFFNYGTLTNNGDLLKGSLANYGNNNYGTIITGKKSKTYINKAADTEATTVGRINNSEKAKVVANVDQIIFFQYEDVTAKELAAEEFTTYSINALRVTGTLTMDVAFSDLPSTDITDATGLGSLKILELADGAEIEVRTNVDAESYFEKVVLEGDANIFGWDKDNSSLTLTNQNLVIEVWEAYSTTSTTAGNVIKVEDIEVVASATPTRVDKRTDSKTQYSLATTLKLSSAVWGTYADGAKLTAGATITATSAQ